jgi:hypothetical protein
MRAYPLIGNHIGNQRILARRKLLRGVEARVGIEPTHKGFADLSLTAWVPRHLEQL